VEDREILNTIKRVYDNDGYICCPHTATAFYARQHLKEQAWIVVATADPCKFDTAIEPIIKAKVPMAAQLQRLLAKPNKIQPVKASLNAIRAVIE
jgi:threonine synthase